MTAATAPRRPGQRVSGRTASSRRSHRTRSSPRPPMSGCMQLRHITRRSSGPPRSPAPAPPVLGKQKRHLETPISALQDLDSRHQRVALAVRARRDRAHGANRVPAPPRHRTFPLLHAPQDGAPCRPGSVLAASAEHGVESRGRCDTSIKGHVGRHGTLRRRKPGNPPLSRPPVLSRMTRRVAGACRV